MSSADCAYETFGGVRVGSSIVMPASSCGTGVACAVSSDALAVAVGDGVSSSSDAEVVDVGFGLVTVSPFESTVFVVPSGEVTVDVELSGVGEGAASEYDSGASVTNAARIKEIILFLFIIKSLPPFLLFYTIYFNLLLYRNNNYNAIKFSLNL